MIHFPTVNQGLGRPQHLSSSTTPSTFLTVNNLATWRNPHHRSFGEVERTFWSALWRETHRLQNDFQWCSEQFLLLPFHILDLTKRPFFVLGVACFDISMQLLFSHKAQNIESSFGCPEEAPDFGSRGLYWKADVPPGIPLGLFSLNDKVVVFPHASIWIKNIFNIWDESFGCFEKKYPGFNCTYVCPPAKSQVAKRFWQKMVNLQLKSAVAFQGASQWFSFPVTPSKKIYNALDLPVNKPAKYLPSPSAALVHLKGHFPQLHWPSRLPSQQQPCLAYNKWHETSHAYWSKRSSTK